MASLRKRQGKYYIRFFKSIDGKKKQKAFSLNTNYKREAEKLLFEYQDLFERGEIDPFDGWTPKIEANKKRSSLKGKYMSLSDASKKFIENRSQANQVTKDNYQRHFNMLMEKVGTTMPVTSIIEEDIREFCFRSDLAPATQRSYLTHLKVFFRWLFEKEIIKTDPTKNLKPPRIPEKIAQKIINQDELGKIFKVFDTYSTKMKEKGYVTKPEQQRLWFKPMISTIFYCGLRAKEAVNLTWRDVQLPKNVNDQVYGAIKVTNKEKSTTKSGKERVIPIRAPLYPILKQWYKDQGSPADGYVFPSATGMSEWHRMDQLALSKSFKKFVKLCDDVPNTITLHGLRHSCATDLLSRGVPAVVVQKIMGHASLNTTMIYEHIDSNIINNAIKGIDG